MFKKIGKMALTAAMSMGLVAGGVALVASPAQAAVIYLHDGVTYSGARSASLGQGYIPDLRGFSFNDIASSMTVTGPGLQITLWEHINYKGGKGQWVWSASDNSFANNTFTSGVPVNNNISSVY